MQKNPRDVAAGHVRAWAARGPPAESTCGEGTRPGRDRRPSASELCTPPVSTALPALLSHQMISCGTKRSANSEIRRG